MFYVYIASGTAELFNIPKFMIVALVSNARTYITHINNHDLYMLEEGSLIPRQHHQFDADSPFTAVRYGPPERHDQQAGSYKAIKN